MALGRELVTRKIHHMNRAGSASQPDPKGERVANDWVQTCGWWINLLYLCHGIAVQTAILYSMGMKFQGASSLSQVFSLFLKSFSYYKYLYVQKIHHFTYCFLQFYILMVHRKKSTFSLQEVPSQYASKTLNLFQLPVSLLIFLLYTKFMFSISVDHTD